MTETTLKASFAGLHLMSNERPYLLASSRTFHWTLEPCLSWDYFSFADEGAAALLLISMHLTDPQPWLAARHPLYLARTPGLIDQESKRILGKRYRSDPAFQAGASEALDPIARVLELIEKTGHSFAEEAQTPRLEKIPGQLLPRKLTATAALSFHGQSWTFHSRNFTEQSQCLHAELTLIFAVSRFLSQWSERPDRLEEFRLLSTLKPCKMCAAFLQIVRRRCNFFQVLYAEDDPGRLAANTLLDQHGYASPGAHASPAAHAKEML